MTADFAKLLFRHDVNQREYCIISLKYKTN